MKETDNTQLCEVGDQLYRVSKIYKSDKYFAEPITIVEATQVSVSGHWYYHDNEGRSYFNRNIRTSCYKTQEEAEVEILRRQNLTKKRKLLKDYERKLNEELKLGDHYIVK